MNTWNITDRWSRALRHQERVEQVGAAAHQATARLDRQMNANPHGEGRVYHGAAAALLCWAEAHPAHWRGPQRQAPTARPDWWVAAGLPDRRQRSSGAAWTAASLAAYWRLREACLPDLTKLASVGEAWQEVAFGLVRPAGRGALSVMDRLNVAAAITNELYRFLLHEPQEAAALEMAGWLTAPLPVWKGDGGYTQVLQEHLRSVLGFWEYELSRCIPPVFGARWRELGSYGGDERYMCREHIEFAVGPGWKPLRDGWDNPGPSDEWRCVMCGEVLHPTDWGKADPDAPLALAAGLPPDDIPF